MCGVSFSLRIREAIAASPTGNNIVAKSVLGCSILVEDGFPIRFHGANASRNDLVEQRDDGLLGKVFCLICMELEPETLCLMMW